MEEMNLMPTLAEANVPMAGMEQLPPEIDEAAPSALEKVKADKAIGEVRPEDYQVLFIPGGYSPDHLRMDSRFVEFAPR